MNIQEQVTSFRTKRNEVQERQLAIMKAAGDEGRTLDDEESSEYDGLTTEIKHIDDHLKRLAVLAGEEVKTETTKAQAPMGFVRKQDPDDAFPGQSFVRRIIAKTLAQMGGYEQTAGQIAERRWGKSHPTLCRVIKAGVPGGSAYGEDSDSWGMELVTANNRFTGDFIEYLKAQTIYDRLPLREVPANVLIKGQEGIGSASWVGEKKPIAMSAQDFIDVELRHLKIAALSVCSVEWLKFSDPSGEQLLRDGLVTASSEETDKTFLSDDALDPGISPAGMLAGLSGGLTSAGPGAAELREDIKQLMAPFITARNSTGLGFVANPSLALAISLLYNELGVQEFPTANQTGGTLHGQPLWVGDFVDPNHLILLKPSDIWRIGATGVEVSLSRDATIEMDTVPLGSGSGPVPLSANPVSMFQTEQVAFKVVRPINFQKRRAHAVQYIGDADYGLGS